MRWSESVDTRDVKENAVASEEQLTVRNQRLGILSNDISEAAVAPGKREEMISSGIVPPGHAEPADGLAGKGMPRIIHHVAAAERADIEAQARRREASAKAHSNFELEV